MEYNKITRENGSIEFKVKGDFSSSYLKEIQDDILAAIRKKKTPYFLFDFSEVTYLDSMGILTLVTAGKYNYQKNKKLTVKSPKDNVKRILDIAEITFIEVVD